MTRTRNVAAAPMRVDDDRPLPAFRRRLALVLLLQPVADHARLRQRERGEHADHVELDQPVEIGVERQDQQARERAQDDDAVREHEAVAAVGELPRHEPVASQDRGEPREVLVGRVRGEHQDGRGEELHEVEEEPAAEHGMRDLPDDRSFLADRDALDVGRQVRDPDEHRHRDDPHDEERLGRVLGLGATERRHAVGDRLDTRQGGRARRERVQDHEQADRAHRVASSGAGRTGSITVGQPAKTHAPSPPRPGCRSTR